MTNLIDKAVLRSFVPPSALNHENFEELASKTYIEDVPAGTAKRNANIIMVTDGVLMRLSKEDFNALLKEPMLSWVSRDEADKMVAEGKSVWVDVRLESEFKNNGIPGSVNIPLFMLRMKVDKLDQGKTYILYCDTGRRSSAAAFLLSERGLYACCLKGGLGASG